MATRRAKSDFIKGSGVRACPRRSDYAQTPTRLSSELCSFGTLLDHNSRHFCLKTPRRPLENFWVVWIHDTPTLTMKAAPVPTRISRYTRLARLLLLWRRLIGRLRMGAITFASCLRHHVRHNLIERIVKHVDEVLILNRIISATLIILVIEPSGFLISDSIVPLFDGHCPDLTSVGSVSEKWHLKMKTLYNTPVLNNRWNKLQLDLVSVPKSGCSNREASTPIRYLDCNSFIDLHVYSNSAFFNFLDPIVEFCYHEIIERLESNFVPGQRLGVELFNLGSTFLSFWFRCEEPVDNRSCLLADQFLV